MTAQDLPPAATAEDSDATPSAVPHVALGLRGRPPAKVYATKNLAARSLFAAPKEAATLRERLHGKAPAVRWPKSTTRKPALIAVPTADSPSNENLIAKKGEKKGENMSERFIAERLLSDRGAAFNPQIPRRVLDIPSPGAVESSEADFEGKRLIIGRQVAMSGEIGGCERLIVEGTVDATLKDIKILEVGGQGTFKGNATVETAVVAGTFEGKLVVSGHLEIGTGAVVKGTVSYGTIAVANGGKLLGTIESA